MSSHIDAVVRDDYYVFLSEREVEKIQLDHLVTVIDPDLLAADAAGSRYPNCVAGATEWSGIAGGRLVSVGWDWICLHDMAIGILDPLHIRTNVMLADAKGAALGDDLTATVLLARLRDLPWQGKLRGLVLERACAAGSPAADTLHWFS